MQIMHVDYSMGKLMEFEHAVKQILPQGVPGGCRDPGREMELVHSACL